MKVKCKHCGAFVDRDGAYRVGLSSYCSNDHFIANRTASAAKRTAIKRKAKKDPMPPAIAETVLTRDDRTCRLCRGTDLTQIHHIRYRSEGGPHTVENLIVLCGVCHTTVHGNKKYWQPKLLEMVQDE